MNSAWRGAGSICPHVAKITDLQRLEALASRFFFSSSGLFYALRVSCQRGGAILDGFQILHQPFVSIVQFRQRRWLLELTIFGLEFLDVRLQIGDRRFDQHELLEQRIVEFRLQAGRQAERNLVIVQRGLQIGFRLNERPPFAIAGKPDYFDSGTVPAESFVQLIALIERFQVGVDCQFAAPK